MAKYGKLIGKGSFSKVYRQGNDAFVTIVSDDPAKECAALFPVDSDHFARIEQVEYGVYRAEYLPVSKGIKDKVSKKAWHVYKALNKATAENKFRNGYMSIIAFLETLPDCDETQALMDFTYHFTNYCNESMRIEASPRNVRVRDNGKLVFLDCFFCADELSLLR